MQVFCLVPIQSFRKTYSIRRTFSVFVLFWWCKRLKVENRSGAHFFNLDPTKFAIVEKIVISKLVFKTVLLDKVLEIFVRSPARSFAPICTIIINRYQTIGAVVAIPASE